MNLLEMVEVAKVFSDTGGSAAVSGFDLVVEPGSSTAIVGRNGAGKSTVLRMAAGLLAPSSGRVSRTPRCFALLDLGMAFHPDLTGDENLDLALALAGLTSAESADVRDQVIEFAGLGRELDKQVKHYSSGMIARLACSVCIHSGAELLLIDEVLAVGDASFQRAMLDRVASAVAAGAALVMVTHSAELAAMATTHAVWLEQGRPVTRGSTVDVLHQYQAASGGIVRSYRSAGVRMGDLRATRQRVAPSDPLHLEFRVDVDAPLDHLAFRVEMRPVVGDSEPWMRPIDEPMEHRNLNLLATTRDLVVDGAAAGTHRVTLSIPELPISPTSLEVGVVALDATGSILDELTTEVEVGTSPRRPQYLVAPTWEIATR